MYMQTAHSYFPLVSTRLDSQIYVELISFSSNWIPTFIEVPEIASTHLPGKAASSCCDSQYDGYLHAVEGHSSFSVRRLQRGSVSFYCSKTDHEKNKSLITHPEVLCAPPYNLSMSVTSQRWIRWRIRDCWGWRKVYYDDDLGIHHWGISYSSSAKAALLQNTSFDVS